MLSEQMLNDLQLFLNLGSFVCIVFLFLVFGGLVALFIFWNSHISSKTKKDDLKKLEEKLTLEIKKVKDKELTAKECALMNIESDIKYIRDKFKENK